MHIDLVSFQLFMLGYFMLMAAIAGIIFIVQHRYRKCVGTRRRRFRAERGRPEYHGDARGTAVQSCARSF